ncbi:MAG: tetratricopeptide repeat protein [Bacteroidota bacterium]
MSTVRTSFFIASLFLLFSCAEKVNPHALMQSAREKMGKEDYLGAEKDLLAALQADSTFDSAHFLLGSLKQQLAQYDEAITHYNRAIQYNPNYPEAYNNRALCNGVSGNLEAEKADLDKALELNPRNQHAWYNRGNYWLDHNQPEKAVEDYSKAIELVPDYSNAFFNRGEARFNLGDFSASYADYKMVTELTPDDGEAWFMLGNCCSRLDSLGKACTLWKKALELGYAEAKNPLQKNCSE